MSEVIAKISVKRESGYLYFIDQSGDLARAPMAKGKTGKSKIEIVAKTAIKKEKGYLYFLDKNGNISRAAMARRGK